jgi:hypothetical protein
MSNPIIALGITGTHAEDAQLAAQSFCSIVSVDNGSAAAGQTITAGMTTQATGYQLVAADTWFSTVTPGVTGNGNTPTAAAVLPLTGTPTGPKSLVGAVFKVINTGANAINVYANPGDTTNSINQLATNSPIVLGSMTITPFECVAPGIWFCDGIGEGQSGSIATTVSQGNITAAGTNQAGATPVTQALANVTTTGSGAGVVLPPAKAGMMVTVANNGANTLTVYGNGSDTIGGAASTTITAATLLLFFCATNGNWLTH